VKKRENKKEKRERVSGWPLFRLFPPGVLRKRGKKEGKRRDEDKSVDTYFTTFSQSLPRHLFTFHCRIKKKKRGEKKKKERHPESVLFFLKHVLLFLHNRASSFAVIGEKRLSSLSVFHLSSAHRGLRHRRGGKNRKKSDDPPSFFFFLGGREIGEKKKRENREPLSPKGLPYHSLSLPYYTSPALL